MNPIDRLELEYEILDATRMGGLGAVYRARHLLLHEIRVIKILPDADEVSSDRLRTAGTMDHPRIPRVFGHGADDAGRIVLITEAVHGIDLKELVRRSGALDIGLALEIAQQAFEAVAFLHHSSILHGHIMPTSFVVERGEDNTLQVKMVDLSVTQALGRALRPATERIRYSAPEQLRLPSESVFDSSGDVYSFCLVLHELLTGRPLFSGDGAETVLRGRLDKTRQSFAPSDFEERIPEELRTLLAKGLAADPLKRPRSAQALLEELHRFRAAFPNRAEAAGLDLRPAPGSVISATAGAALEPAEDAYPDSTLEMLLRTTAGTAENDSEAVREDSPDRAHRGARERDMGIVASALLVSARSMINHGDLAGAVAKLRRVLTMNPGDSSARDLLASTESNLLEKRADMTRSAELHTITTMIAGRIDAGEIADARQSLTLAHQVYGADPMLAEIEEKLFSDSNHDLGDHLAAARRSLEASDVRRTFSELRRAGEHEPGASEVQELMQETMRRHAETTVAEYLENGEIAEAWRSLAIAEKVFGTSPGLQELRRRLDSRAKENTVDAVTALVTSARILVEAGDHRAALQQLRRAGAVDPGNAEVREMTRVTLQRHAEATVESYLDLGEQEDAKVALSVARKRFSSSLGLLAYDLELTGGASDETPPEPKQPTRRSTAGLDRLRKTRVLKDRVRPTRATRRKMLVGGNRQPLERRKK